MVIFISSPHPEVLRYFAEFKDFESMITYLEWLNRMVCILLKLAIFLTVFWVICATNVTSATTRQHVVKFRVWAEVQPKPHSRRVTQSEASTESVSPMRDRRGGVTSAVARAVASTLLLSLSDQWDANSWGIKILSRELHRIGRDAGLVPALYFKLYCDWPTELSITVMGSL